MNRTVRDRLLEALDELDEDQFKRFKHKLPDTKEEERIRRGLILHLDRMDVTDKLVNFYTESDAVRVAVRVLQELGFNHVAQQLQQTAEAQTRSGTTSDKHIIDIIRSELIQRVCMVNPILDKLLEKDVICSETYSEIHAKSTEQAKMRALFEGPLRSCGKKGKDELYAILKEEQPMLMKDLLQN